MNYEICLKMKTKIIQELQTKYPEFLLFNLNLLLNPSICIQEDGFVYLFD